MKHIQTQRLVLAALFLSLALVLPFLTGQIPDIGSMLCPMHFPILLAGFLCGPIWGCAVGAAAPLLRSLIFGMPPLFPAAVCMAPELAVYGAVSGVLYLLLPKRLPWCYVALLSAMLAGRVVWGIAMLIALGVGSFGLPAFLAGAFTGALPGIVLQIVLIPPAVLAARRLLSR